MYAVIQTGGKQYRVEEGQTLKFEKLSVDEGAEVEFDRVLLIKSGDDIKVGKPFVDGGRVTGRVHSQGRHKKIKIIKFRRRKHHMKQMGHRQDYTEVRITGISVGVQLEKSNGA
ncbi:MAG: 50S ribosomal protein L21 [Methylococcaceae bacterium]|nr:50S ribosomal protein L21 [Methylococcaceae bacterium]